VLSVGVLFELHSEKISSETLHILSMYDWPRLRFPGNEILCYLVSIYCSTILCWTLAALLVSRPFTQPLGLLGRRMSPLQGRFLHTEQHNHRINAYTDIHASSGIRTHDSCVWAGEDSSCTATMISCYLVYYCLLLNAEQKWNQS
jgi:hypothetical protein